MSPRFECQNCGKCCFDYASSIRVTEDDVLRWKKQKRSDILRHLTLLKYKGRHGDILLSNQLWIKPRRQDMKLRCPFIQKKSNKFFCRIHDTKPELCRLYPFDEAGKLDKTKIVKCKGILEV